MNKINGIVLSKISDLLAAIEDQLFVGFDEGANRIHPDDNLDAREDIVLNLMEQVCKVIDDILSN